MDAIQTLSQLSYTPTEGLREVGYPSGRARACQVGGPAAPAAPGPRRPRLAFRAEPEVDSTGPPAAPLGRGVRAFGPVLAQTAEYG